MGRGINDLLKFLDSSPSPQPSPVKGEGVFLTFYEIINIPIFHIFGRGWAALWLLELHVI